MEVDLARHQMSSLSIDQVLKQIKEVQASSNNDPNATVLLEGYRSPCLKVSGQSIYISTGISKKVRRVRKEDCDGVGYDNSSITPEGNSRLVEVKTTNGWERIPFHISRNELAVAED